LFWIIKLQVLPLQRGTPTTKPESLLLQRVIPTAKRELLLLQRYIPTAKRETLLLQRVILSAKPINTYVTTSHFYCKTKATSAITSLSYY